MLKRESESSGAATVGKQRSLLQRFYGDRSGSISLIFGLSIIPLTAIVGLAVDYGRVYAVKSHTQAALDAAALAAGRVAQVEKTDTLNKISAAATAFFNQAKPTGVVDTAMVFSPNSANTEFKVTATSWVRTPFLGVLHVLFNQGSEFGAPAGCTGNYFGCLKVTTTATAALCPSAACSASTGGGSSTAEKLEIAMMLDVTGSMCDPCSKIDALKKAAKDFLKILDGAPDSVRIALAPFAEAVNVGTTLAPKLRGTVTNNQQSSPQNFTTSSALNNTSNQPTNKWIRFSSVNNSNSNGCSSSSDQCTWQISSKCVTERIGTEATSDVAPDPSIVSTLLGKGYFGTNADSSCGVANYSDPDVNLIQPLTNSKSVLTGRIDKLTTGGSTAGHLGTAWAYYLLSPKWNSLFPSSSAAASYADTIDPRPNKPKTGSVKKVAVLMTDGEYNINYCKGVEAKNSDQSPDINCNSENGKSLTQATSLCTAMKNAKVDVYTIGFQVNSTAKTFLGNCASDANKFYDAETPASLEQAYRDIMLRIIDLRLTH